MQDLVLIVPKEMVNTGVMVNVNGIVRMASVYLKVRHLKIVKINQIFPIRSLSFLKKINT